MKKQASKLYIYFLLFSIGITIIMGLAYRFLAKNYLSVYVMDAYQADANNIAYHFSDKLKEDYAILETYVNSYKDNGYTDDEVVDNLILNDDAIAYNAKYGLIKSTGYRLMNEETTFLSNYSESSIYSNKVYIYSFDNILSTSDSNLYMVFRFGDIIIYLDSNNYFNANLETIDNLVENYYFIIDDDMHIIYQKDNYLEYTSLKAELIDNSTNFKTKVDAFNNTLRDKKTTKGYVELNLHKDKVAMFYTAFDREYVASGVYLIISVDKDALVSAHPFITNIFLVGAIILIMVINFALLIILIIINKRMRELNASSFALFMARPYVITVTRKGKIKALSRSVSTNLKSFHKKYKDVADFTPVKDGVNILFEIHKQQPFEIIYTEDDKTVYIRFMVITKFSNFILIGQDITEEYLENEQNRKKALYNNITNLPNKYVLDKDVENALKDDSLVSFMLSFDIIDYQKLNKLFGFKAVDRLMVTISTKVMEAMKDDNAKLYNIRTSKFIILYRTNNDKNITNFANKIMNLLKEPFNVTEKLLTVIEVKMGIFYIDKYQYPDITPDECYMNVEETLLRAKASRLVSYLFYSSDFSRLISRDQMMEEDLKVAITNHEFMMYYQPQYNTAINKIVGLEALIRWNNPKYISENVEHFIKLAEKNGMIVEIGEFIIDETFKFAKKIEDKNIHISMNVSPVQLLQSGFVSELIEKFDFYKLKPGSISLEITETFLMENTELVLDKLKLLQGKGFHIHLDDFGVGYSSMLYLKNLPVNAIKIDKEFIKYLLIDRFSKVIVSKIAQIATQLDLEIIAEGVEDVNQALYLSKNNCDIIQGFLISQAVSEEKTLELISKYNEGPTIDIFKKK